VEVGDLGRSFGGVTGEEGSIEDMSWSMKF